ncbi:MAG: glycosyltransferase family 4 protein [bacterium]|nr:glycosyltransferase family 4 protein [bacterium]
MKRIRVLHLHTLPVISGSGLNTWITIKGTCRQRFEVAFACAPGGGLNDMVRQAGFPVHEIPSLRQPIRPVRDLRALFDIVQILRRERIDLLHTHNSKTGWLGRLAGKIAGTPVVIHTVHGFAFHAAERPWRRALFKKLERMAAPWADHTIFISQPMIEWAREEDILRENRYSRIYSGIDLERFQPVPRQRLTVLRTELGLQEDDRVIGFVSKLWEGKGHAVALQAMAHVIRAVPRAKLLLVGDGPLEDRLRVLCEELNLQEAVIFAGFRKDIPEVFGLCELAILPSLFEGMGRVLLEAGACGKPVVATAVGGIPEVVVHGETGLLVPPDDPVALFGDMVRLLRDRTLARKMGEAGVRRIGELFSAHTMVRQISAVYEACLQEKELVHGGEREDSPLPPNPISRRKAG